MKNRKYHTVGTVPKSGKTKNITLSEQVQNLEKQKMTHCRNSSKIWRKKNATLSEHFQNLEKEKMTHCRNSSKIWKNKKCHNVRTVPNSYNEAKSMP
jgi:hypothetical protein